MMDTLAAAHGFAMDKAFACHDDLMLDVWDTDLPVSDSLDGSSHHGLFDALIRTDRLLTDSLGTTTSEDVSMASNPPAVKTEHSYSMTGSDGDSIPDSPLSNNDDMEDECYPCMPTGSLSSEHHQSSGYATHHSMLSSLVKEEPLSPANSITATPAAVVADDPANLFSELFAPAANLSGLIVKEEPKDEAPATKSLVMPKSSSKVTSIPVFGQAPNNRVVFPKVSLDTRKHSSNHSGVVAHQEQQRSPIKAVIRTTSTASHAHFRAEVANPQQLQQSVTGAPVSTTTTKVIFGHPTPSTRHPIQTSLISSQPKGATGVLYLTEEEKRTLISEGYPVPQRLPLTKSEEKSLKKIRRKIKNKISAQESRRKKKEYMDCLERRMQALSDDLEAYKQRYSSLESQNSSLRSQLEQVQAQLANCNCINSVASHSAAANQCKSFKY